MQVTKSPFKVRDIVAFCRDLKKSETKTFLIVEPSASSVILNPDLETLCDVYHAQFVNSNNLSFL